MIPIQEIIAVAKDAGEKILHIYSEDDFDVKIKTDDSQDFPLTRADTAANTLICSQLEKYGYPILSEEGSSIPFDERKNWKTYWCIDPLDGTKEFIKKNGEFTVNIALIQDSVAIMGVIYVPVTGEVFYASKGSGAFYQKGDVVSQLPLQEAPKDTVVASKSHCDDRTLELIKQKGYSQIISKGSSLKFCLVAQGFADSYIRNIPTYEWDTAAASAILTELGIDIVRIDSLESFTYNRKNLKNSGFFTRKK